VLTALSRPLNSVGMPYYHDTLLSAWPTHLISDIGAPPARYDQTYLDSLQSWEYGLFGRNTRPTRRGQAEDTRSSGKLANSIQAPKFLSDKSRETSSDTGAAPALGDGDATDPRAVAELESLKPDAPSMYQRVEIKFSKFGVDDFDFGCVPRADSRPGRMLMSLQVLQQDLLCRSGEPHYKLICKFTSAGAALYASHTEPGPPPCRELLSG